MECSVCSILNFLGLAVYNIISSAFQYPILTFLISVFIGFVIISNIHTAHMICNYNANQANNPPLPASTGQTNSVGTCVTRTTLNPPRPSSAPTNSTKTMVLQDPNNFDYGIERGPHTWNAVSSNQSPINIIDERVKKLPIRELLTWNHYDDLPLGILMENNGHTVVIRAAFAGNTPTISGADLLASYTFVELCFRWGIQNNEGSEHMLNYRKFPLELQAMHRTGPPGERTSSYDILMIAYFFEISANNPYLEPIVQNLHRIQKPGTSVEIPPFPLSYLCHQFRTAFYSYGGSLTEPPCYQGAEWFIFPEPLAISDRQLNEFRQMLSTNGTTRILRNSRPIQPLNQDRTINFNQYDPIEVSPANMCGGESVNNLEEATNDGCCTDYTT